MGASYTGGRFVISPSGPGVLAGTSVTDSGCTATSNIAISVISGGKDAVRDNGILIVAGSGAFTATCTWPQLVNTLTVNYILVNTA
jgi:hypothetical protein